MNQTDSLHPNPEAAIAQELKHARTRLIAGSAFCAAVGMILGIVIPYFYLNWLTGRANAPGAPDAQIIFADHLNAMRWLFYIIFGGFGTAFGLWYGIRFTLSAFQRSERKIRERHMGNPT